MKSTVADGGCGLAGRLPKPARVFRGDPRFLAISLADRGSRPMAPSVASQSSSRRGRAWCRPRPWRTSPPPRNENLRQPTWIGPCDARVVSRLARPSTNPRGWTLSAVCRSAAGSVWSNRAGTARKKGRWMDARSTHPNDSPSAVNGGVVYLFKIIAISFFSMSPTCP